MNATVGKMPGSDGAIHTQFGLINLLKAGAAQLIILHHLAFYGPMSDHVRPLLHGDPLQGSDRPSAVELW